MLINDNFEILINFVIDPAMIPCNEMVRKKNRVGEDIVRTKNILPLFP